MAKVQVVFALVRKSGNVVLSRHMDTLVKASRPGDTVRRARIEDLAAYTPRNEAEAECVSIWKRHIQGIAVKAKVAKINYAQAQTKEAVKRQVTVSQETQEWIDNYRAENPVSKFDSSLVPHTNRE